MSTAATEDELHKLRTLYLLREKKALAALSEQQLEVARVLARREEQLELIRGLREDLAQLYERRSTSNIGDMTAQSLQQESDRRRWLVHDLEQEEFYLPGFESDVADAKSELRMRQRAWLRVRERLKMLDSQADTANKRNTRVEVRREESQQDDRKTGFVFYG